MGNSLFSLDLVKNENLDTTNVLESSYVEESYFISTLNFITESKKELGEHTKDLYKNILECTDQEVLNESFNDFLSKAKTMIDKFLKFIKSMVDRFIAYLNKMIASDRYIRKNKDIFKKFTDDHEFELDGYYFTFDENIPAINALAEFNKDFLELDFDIMNGNKSNGDYIKYITAQQGTLSSKLNNGFYDQFRAEVLGKENYEITQGEFAEELFETFRGGYSKKDTITINAENLINSLSFFLNYKDFEKEVKKTKDKIEKEYRTIEKSVERLIKKGDSLEKTIALVVSPEYDGAPSESFNVSQEVFNKLNLFTKAKINQISEMSAIHSMAFSYKLDAIKECYNQDKKILYRALSEIQKDKSLR